jgi:murein DD-endopeptidase MepM/ murein hydrolase activator NlpD
MLGSSSPVWPLGSKPKAPTTFGSFGQPRPSKSDPERTHLGVDLAAKEMDPVYAMEDGILKSSQGWDGPEAKAIWLETYTGLSILYGAVAPGTWPKLPTPVKRGQPIAKIGRYPGGSTMLHLETWASPVSIPRPAWPWGAPKPAQALDPADYLARVGSGAQGAQSGNQGLSSPLIAVAGIGVLGYFLLRGKL